MRDEKRPPWLQVAVASAVSVLAMLLILLPAAARDDGRYANSPLKSWFDGLKSGRGPCCSFADGVSVADVDVGTRGGRYWVRHEGAWLEVPDDALVTVPNKFGLPVLWPYVEGGVTKVRCFIPGAGT